MTDDIRSELSRLRKAEQLKAEDGEYREELGKICQEPIYLLRSSYVKKDQEHFTVQRKKLRGVYIKHNLTQWKNLAFIRSVQRYLGNCGNFSEWSREKKQYQHAGKRQIWHAKFTKIS